MYLEGHCTVYFMNKIGMGFLNSDFIHLLKSIPHFRIFRCVKIKSICKGYTKQDIKIENCFGNNVKHCGRRTLSQSYQNLGLCGSGTVC